jgi:hypothetical protein
LICALHRRIQLTSAAMLLDCWVYDSNSDIAKLVLKDKSNHSELRSKETAQADKQSVSLSPSLFGPQLPTALWATRHLVVVGRRAQ